MKKIIITGAYGYLGRVLMKNLSRKYKIIALDNMLYHNDKIINNRNIKSYIGSFDDEYILEKIFKTNKKIYATIHLGGISNDPTSALSKKLTKNINVIATDKLVKISKKNNVKVFLFASSCSVYGFTGKKTLINEESKLNPISEYALSKIKGEKICIRQASDKFKVICLRKATLFGYSPRMRFDLVINTMTGSAVTDKKIFINGGNQWRPFLHVKDAADAYNFFLENSLKKNKNYEILNIGKNELNFKIKKLASIISNITKAKCKLSKNPDNRSYKVSFNKLNKIYKFIPKISVEQGVREIIKILKSGKIKNFKDINYYNVKRLIVHLNIN